MKMMQMNTTTDTIARQNKMKCEWFLKCGNEATGYEPDITGDEVPICDRCKAKLIALES